jgi:hypothetical protein
LSLLLSVPPIETLEAARYQHNNGRRHELPCTESEGAEMTDTTSFGQTILSRRNLLVA